MQNQDYINTKPQQVTNKLNIAVYVPVMMIFISASLAGFMS